MVEIHFAKISLYKKVSELFSHPVKNLMEKYYFYLFFLTICANLVFCAEVPKRRKLKILVYSPLAAWSHMKFMGKIADTLAEAGHEVHYFKFVSDPILGPKNETKLAQKVYRVSPKLVDPAQFQLENWDPIRDPFKGEGWPLLIPLDNNLYQILDVWVAFCKEITANVKLLAELTREHYDVALSEMYDQCPFSIFHRIGVKTKLATVAIPLYQMGVSYFGIPSFASYMPNMYAMPINGQFMNFRERFFNFYNTLYGWLVVGEYTHNKGFPILHDNFGPDFPSSREIYKNISLVFVNTNEFLEFPRPISNKIINIGGIVEPELAEMDQRTKSIFDKDSDGVVLVSFGSVADTRKMSDQMKEALLATFVEFPEFEFILKMDPNREDKKLFESAKNVHIFEWVQQPTILGHPKLRAFITHCGLNSLSEAVRAGVPIVAIPLFADQLYNAILAQNRGLGIYVDVRRLNRQNAETILIDALQKVIFQPEYRQNVLEIQRKFELTPFSPSEKLVKWVEFAAEFPDLNELNLPGDGELAWWTYYSVDVLSFTIFMIICWIFISWKFIKFLSDCIRNYFPNDSVC